MPTISELGQKVKAKYPGAYDDLGDGEVGRRVQAKYPGAYSDFTDAPAAPPQPTTGRVNSFLSGTGKGLASTVLGVSNLGRKFERAVGLQALYRKAGMPEEAVAPKLNMGAVKPQNTAERVGFAAEQIGELLTPLGGEAASTKVFSKVLPKVGASKAGALAARSLGSGAEFAAKGALQTGGDRSATAGGFLSGLLAVPLFEGAKAAVKYATRNIPERIMSRIFKTAEEDLRAAYQTEARGVPLNPTLAREALERNLKGNSKNMAVYAFKKLDDLEQQVQAMAGQSDELIKLDAGQGKKEYKTLLLAMKNQFQRTFFSKRAKEADALLGELKGVKGDGIPMKTALKLRRFLDNMRNTSSFRLDATLAPKQEEFKVAANILRKKLADAGLGDLMNEERFFIEAIDSIVSDAAKRQNRNIIGLVDLLAGGGGLVSGSPLGGVTAAAAIRGFQQPVTLTNLAQVLYKGGRAVAKPAATALRKGGGQLVKAAATFGSR